MFVDISPGVKCFSVNNNMLMLNGCSSLSFISFVEQFAYSDPSARFSQSRKATGNLVVGYDKPPATTKWTDLFTASGKKAEETEQQASSNKLHEEDIQQLFR